MMVIGRETRFFNNFEEGRGEAARSRQIVDRREKCHSYAKQIVPARSPRTVSLFRCLAALPPKI